MSDSGLNRIALIIAAITVSSLVGPKLALPLFGILGILIVEQVVWGGRFSSLLGAWLDWRSPEYRERVIRHEAGHLTAACVLGIPVVGYVLDPWQAFRQGYPDYGGVQLDTEPIESWQKQGQISSSDVDRYGTFWMAGGAAEYLYSGQVQGDGSDQRQVMQLLALLRSPSGKTPDPGPALTRYRRQAKEILDNHPQAFDIAVECLKTRVGIQDCQQRIQAQLEG